MTEGQGTTPPTIDELLAPERLAQDLAPYPRLAVVGFQGPEGIGKTTHATLLRLWLGAHDIATLNVPLADPVKDLADMRFRLPHNPFARSGLSRHRATPLPVTIPPHPSGIRESTRRWAYRVEGTDIARTQHHDRFWVWHLHERVCELADLFYRCEPITSPLVLTVDDVRFDNEARYLADVPHGLLAGVRWWTVQDEATVETAAVHRCEAGLSSACLATLSQMDRLVVVWRSPVTDGTPPDKALYKGLDAVETLGARLLRDLLAGGGAP